MEVLDLWDTPQPTVSRHSKGCSVKYEHRIVWCCIPHIKRNPFYTRQLVELALELYGEKLHPFTVAMYLKKLSNLGYIERTKLINDTATYIYSTTTAYRNFWKEEAY